jgi:hypothetical protein
MDTFTHTHNLMHATCDVSVSRSYDDDTTGYDVVVTFAHTTLFRTHVRDDMTQSMQSDSLRDMLYDMFDAHDADVIADEIFTCIDAIAHVRRIQRA